MPAGLTSRSHLFRWLPQVTQETGKIRPPKQSHGKSL